MERDEEEERKEARRKADHEDTHDWSNDNREQTQWTCSECISKSMPGSVGTYYELGWKRFVIHMQMRGHWKAGVGQVPNSALTVNIAGADLLVQHTFGANTDSMQCKFDAAQAAHPPPWNRDFLDH